MEMQLIDDIIEFLGDLKRSLVSEFSVQTAKPINFSEIPTLSQTEINALEAVYNSFKTDAERGLFDEDTQAQLRKFLNRQGFEKPQIERAIRELNAISTAAADSQKHTHIATQDRYWDATGLSDTRRTQDATPLAVIRDHS
jgi:hypothetical protein